MLSKIYKGAKKYNAYIIFGTLCVLLYTALNLVSPMFIRQLVKLFGADGLTEDSRGRIIQMGVILIAVYSARVVFRFCYNYFNHKAAWSYVGDLRVALYDHIQGLSIGYFSDKQTGQLLSRVISDAGTIEMLIAHAVPDTITNVLSFIGVNILLFSINPTLALLTCIPLPAVFLGGVFFVKRVRPNFRKAQKNIGELSGTLQDNLSGIKEIQIFNRRQTAREGVKKTSDKYTVAILRAIKISSVFHPAVEFFTSMGTVIVIVGGGLMAIGGRIDAADIVAFVLYLSMFYAPITTLSRVVEDYQNAMAGGERIFEVLDTDSRVKDAPTARPLVACAGNISFENVSFGYDEGQEVLKNICFEVKSGQMLAMAGATGVGKTTVISLLMRFYDVGGGSIKIDGLDIRDITLDSLREQMSIVLQDTFLFNGTIAENIAFAVRDASQAQIEDAAIRARIHEDILKMPDGYDTVVGERGTRLSGGQKQRLSIARAILRDSPILILDEATASVDVETELKIRQAIADIAKNRTIIVIAHRLSTIRQADNILVLENGAVAESGTHQTLIEAGGLYSKLNGAAGDDLRSQ
jgi:ABC-type multidrug transport system fused ATPase/permease subunit